MNAPSSFPQCRRRGRPPLCPPEIALQVLELQDQGLSYSEIATALNREGVPTPSGGQVWYKSCVDRLLHTRHATEIGLDAGSTLRVVTVRLHHRSMMDRPSEQPRSTDGQPGHFAHDPVDESDVQAELERADQAGARAYRDEFGDTSAEGPSVRIAELVTPALPDARHSSDDEAGDFSSAASADAAGRLTSSPNNRT